MTLDNRKDIHDTFYLQEKLKTLQTELARHQQAHAGANQMLIQERNYSTLMKLLVGIC